MKYLFNRPHGRPHYFDKKQKAEDIDTSSASLFPQPYGLFFSIINPFRLLL